MIIESIENEIKEQIKDCETFDNMINVIAIYISENYDPKEVEEEIEDD